MQCVEVTTFDAVNYVRAADLIAMLELPAEERVLLLTNLKKMQLSDAHGASVH